jgi:cell wall assembly regulator SMI1
MQKFTRPITREITLGEERLAVTLGAEGIGIRPVGSRKPPREITWPALLCHLTGHAVAPESEPTREDIAAAVKLLKTAAPKPRATKSASPDEAAPPSEKATPAGTEPISEQPDDEALLGRLERWLAEHRPRYLQGLLPGARAEELDRLQTELGLPLPAGLRDVLSWHNGQSGEFIGSLEQSWNLMSTAQIAAAKKELDAAPSGEQAQTSWKPSWIPFLDDDGGNYLCLDTSQPEAPVREYWAGSPEQPALAPSLAVWLKNFVDAVERGEYVEDPERGAFLRRNSS